ncbi:FAD-binding protein [Chitinasiproducens palmae]|uniref:Succinate dehydrogenase / fumarate reductase flavoprotein subunit/L-aspartate oxidase n=1 Tax=Chitinasiproducens palmae TaxID=1770053 RepID=A0A1H2PKT7_9BURK|nr:FAD-binding protein [Chitinasiproducens palmae]SDV47076.1 succinate dehydrogenase / fumarate reductase flavoprotein subunit/L-aspartate oxidase [Chitinasiproducens palmae]
MTTPGIPYQQALRAWHAATPATARPLNLPAQALLADFHPDRQPGAMVSLRVGASAGQQCPASLAALLEADSLLEDVDIAGAPVQDADVLIIGGGGAGCVAALTAARAGARVLLATKLRLGDSNTVMAEGGIQAAVGADDSLQRHFEDTLRSGHFVGDKSLVAALVSDGPDAIRWLIQEGMSFDLAGDGQRMGGTLLRKKPGGATAARLLSYRDFTGLELMRALREAVLLQPGITVLDRHPALELLSDGRGRCAGAVLHDLARGRSVLARAGATVMATGGAGRLHLGGFPTSNHYGATADGLVLAYRLGAPLREIDSFQFHPTGIAWPAHMEGALVSEAARSSGAFLVNGRGERFVDELQPRDIVAAAILREIREGRGVERDGQAGVFLDTPTLEQSRPGVLQSGLVTLRHLAHRAGFDPAVVPFLVRPTLHYQNGGVVMDVDGRTPVPGLLCAGEVAGGIHGRNRMMGNALLELVVFGRRAGATAAAHARGCAPRMVGLTHLADWRRALIAAGLPVARKAPMIFPAYGNFDIVSDRERAA